MLSNNVVSPISKAKRALNRKMSLAATLIVLSVFAGGMAVLKFADAERTRDIYNWQVKMGLVADRQKAEIDSWLEQQFAELSKLSDNQSLQLYMTELEVMGQDMGAAGLEDEPAEAVFLRNLLTVTAERGGFLAPPSPTSEVKANVEEIGVSGIAIIDNNGKVIVSTRGMPPLEGNLGEFVASLPKGKKGMLDMYKGADDVPTMAFSVPVFSIQNNEEAGQQAGTILGVKTVDKEIFPKLKASYPEFKSAESLLVRVDDGSVVYLSPLKNGKKALEYRISYNTPDLAAAKTIELPGSFVEANDYKFTPVFATGRKIAGTNWTLEHKIDREEAMADSDARFFRLISIFVLVILVIFVGLIAAWRHGSSLKSEKVALRYKTLFNKFKSQEHLLRLVSDNQPDAMFLVDSENVYCYANNEAAKDAGIKGVDMVGKPMQNVIGPHKAQPYIGLNAKALSLSATVSHVQISGDKVIQSKHIPLNNIPSIVSEEDTNGVLVIEQDISVLVAEREKRERTLEQLIDSLVSIVDKHDPNASQHSSRVSKLAKATAEEMELDDTAVKTAEIAGLLMNVGKILIPKELLTKKGDLSEGEIKSIHQSIYATSDFLEGIEFDGPVVETINQSLENWDGSGAKGLKGDDILVTARVVAVANAFVAMTSKRGYREKLSNEEAIKNLLNDVDKKYQRSVVIALVSFIENHGGES